MIGTVELGPASAELSINGSVRPHLRDRVRDLSHINVPEDKRRQGHATRLLEAICEQADVNQVALLLEVKSDGEMTNEELKAWYAKHGFLDLQAEPCLMVRPCRQS